MMEINKLEWLEWANISLEIFPYIKEKDTFSESLALDKIISKYSFKKKENLKIIDILCGWGRHSIALSKRGFIDITCLDFCDASITYCKKTSKKEKLKLNFINKDLLEINLNAEFEVAINMWTSFGIFEKEELNVLMLKKIKSCLVKNGLFILDIVNRDHLLKNIANTSPIDYFQGNKNFWIHKNRIALAEIFVKDKAKNLFNSILIGMCDGKQIGKSEITLRLYNLNEIVKIFSESNFQILNIYGDFNFSIFNSLSPRIIIVARSI